MFVDHFAKQFFGILGIFRLLLLLIKHHVAVNHLDPRFAGDDLFQVLFDMSQQFFRRKRLVGQISRAVILTAAAFGAGITIQQILPGKIRQLIYAKSFSLFIFKVNLLHRLDLAVHIPENNIKRRGRRVKQWRVTRNTDQGKSSQNVHPPEDQFELAGHGRLHTVKQ
ncbi:MAG: hypothetical protein A4E54_01440 [Pelotomaculum sp. PtaB.Bin117]|nr:MAG: hypothetical protein A4E54_01440 [Pelotomaculum sp. PtaB.Bin117]